MKNTTDDSELRFMLEDEMMLSCAFRYCLGRNTYAVGHCVDYLVKHWQDIEKRTRDLIVKEIKAYFKDKMYQEHAHECDNRSWSLVLLVDKHSIEKDDEIVEKRWCIETRICKDCDDKGKRPTIITNGNERWCEGCGVKEQT